MCWSKPGGSSLAHHCQAKWHKRSHQRTGPWRACKKREMDFESYMMFSGCIVWRSERKTSTIILCYMIRIRTYDETWWTVINHLSALHHDHISQRSSKFKISKILKDGSFGEQSWFDLIWHKFIMIAFHEMLKIYYDTSYAVTGVCLEF